MAKYLFTVWPFSGHLHPAIAIAHALRARGHDVAFYTGDSVRSLIEREGFKCFAFKRINEQRVWHLVSLKFPFRRSLGQRLRYARSLRDTFREWLLESIPGQIEDIEEILAVWNAEVLLCDFSFWSPFLVIHETRKVPVAVLSVAAACLIPGPDAPAWGRGLPRPRSAATRLRSRMERSLLKWLSRGLLKAVNATRTRYGLSALKGSVTEFAAQMPLYLVPSTPEYDYFRQDLPPSVRYVGPCLWDKPRDAKPPQWLAQLPDHRDLIYVTEATVGTDEPILLKTAVHALRNEPVQVVITTGRQRDSAELGVDSDVQNIRVEPYIPQSDLLPKTAVMVTLGGSGGVLTALKAGVPLVIVPTEWDRPENAQRVVEAGAGLRIAPDRCTPERLRRAVRRVLSEPSFRRNAQRLSHAFSRYGGAGAAAELLEDLIPTAKRE